MRAALPTVTAPAAAAAALVPTAGRAVCARTDASPPEETGETDLGETGCAVPEAAETNLLAAAARAAEFTPTLGAGVVFLGSVAVFFPFFLHFSSSSTRSRSL